MHLEVFVEDRSGAELLGILLEKILGANGTEHSWNLYPYKGLGGKLPKGLKPGSDPSKRILMDQLTRIVKGMATTMEATGRENIATIIVVDLDRRDCREFKQELLATLKGIYPVPRITFRIAIEEVEAWLLGDKNAIVTAYPSADLRKLESYTQDSICGTWETLADAITDEGAMALKKRHYSEIGKKKVEWALNIGSHMDANRNSSPSFKTFHSAVLDLIDGHR